MNNTKLLGFAVASCAAASSLNAATISSGGISSDVSAPSGLGGSVENLVGLSTSSDLIKFVGDINVTAGISDGGNTTDNSLSIAGSLTLDPGESFLLAYDIGVNLQGGGTVSLIVTSSTTFNGVTETITNTETVTEEGEFNFTFSELGFTAEEATEGSWTGELRFDWTDITADSTLNIVIPNDSIDFAVVPEPSHLSLVLLSSFGFLFRRRK